MLKRGGLSCCTAGIADRSAGGRIFDGALWRRNGSGAPGGSDDGDVPKERSMNDRNPDSPGMNPTRFIALNPDCNGDDPRLD